MPSGVRVRVPPFALADRHGQSVANRAPRGNSYRTRANRKHPAPSGTILRFDIARTQEGRTSVTYTVEVFADEPGATEEQGMFSTHITFVRVDDAGKKIPLGG